MYYHPATYYEHFTGVDGKELLARTLFDAMISEKSLDHYKSKKMTNWLEMMDENKMKVYFCLAQFSSTIYSILGWFVSNLRAILTTSGYLSLNVSVEAYNGKTIR